MVLMVLETEALADAALPVAQLAAHLRLAEGYAAVPGQDDRLRQHLRAAIGTLEARLGKILIARGVQIGGPGTGATSVALPVSPVTALVSAVEIRGGMETVLTGAALEASGFAQRVTLPRAVTADASLRLEVTAGFGAWEAVPAPLAQAVLLVAEALYSGEGADGGAVVEALVAPWKARRLGGGA